MRHPHMLLLAVSVAAAPLFAQMNRGTLTGAVTDASGGSIPNVRVAVRNTGTNARYQAETTESGHYTVPGLPPGSYEATFQARSFKTFVRDGITLGVTDVLRVDVTLEVGSVTESVRVTAEVPRIQTETPEVGTALDSVQLMNLPLDFSSSRAAENFAYAIAPGVSGTNWASHINGSTSASKEVVLDGASVTTQRAGHFGETSVSLEMLQELKVQSTAISAEYGRSQGGVFNFVMKSGTNEIHGTAFGELRNEALNANTFANNSRGLERPADRKQNYAFSFGGPVYFPKIYNGKNRTFFYAAYERYKERDSKLTANRTVPLPEFYEGNFSRLLGAATGQSDGLGRAVNQGAIYDPATFRQLPGGRWIGDMFPGNVIPESRFSRVSQKLNEVAKQYYLPNVRDPSGQFPLLNNALAPQSGNPQYDAYQFSVKGDQSLGSMQRLSGSYSYHVRPRYVMNAAVFDYREPTGGPLSNMLYQRVESYLVRLSHDWTMSPRVLNNITVHFNRMLVPAQPFSYSYEDSAKLGIPGYKVRGFPAVNWGGGPFVTLAPAGSGWASFSAGMGWGAAETISYARGRHFLKTGVDLRRNLSNLQGPASPSFTFNALSTAIPNEAFAGTRTGYSFASYLLGTVYSANLLDPVTLGSRRWYYAAFFQDDFKVHRAFTLNLGVRWEYQPPYTEAADRISSWNPTKPDPQSGLRGAYDFAGRCPACTGERYFGKPSRRGWGPRVGFAYQPFQKWTVRGGYGIYHEGDLPNDQNASPLAKATSVAWGGTYSLAANGVQPWAGIFQWDAGFPPDRFTPASYDVAWANRNSAGMIDPAYGRTSYSQQWSVNIQRQLMKNLIFDVGYIGNKATGLHNSSLSRMNQLPAGALSQFGRRLNNAIRNAGDAAANGIAYPFAGFAGTIASALRPYPQIQGNSTVQTYGSPLGFSSYHALQVTVNRQFGRGLAAYANYVWSKNLSNTQSSQPGDNPGPLDYYNLTLEKAISTYSMPHVVKLYLSYDFPRRRSRRLVEILTGDWSVSLVANYASGAPLGFSGSSPLAGGWNGGNRPNIAAGNLKAPLFDESAFNLLSQGSPANTYLNKSLFSDAPPLTLGNAAPRYAQLRGFGASVENVGLQKNHRIHEKYKIQLRAELLNALNRHLLGGIITNVTSPFFGQVTSVTGNRQVQVGMRLDF